MIDNDPTLLSTLNELAKYLENTPKAKRPNTIYKMNLAKLQRDFRETNINETQELQDKVIRVLIAANIQRQYWGRFVNAPITGYEFLNELLELTNDKEKKQRLNHFLYEIEQIEKTRTRRFIASLIIVLAGVVEFSPFLVAETPAILNAVFSIGVIIPIVGIVYTFAIAAYSFYQTLKDKRLSFADKFIDNFFLLSSSAINVAAYAVLIAAAATFNPIAGLLFVVASFMNVTHQLTKLNYVNGKLKELGPIKESDTLVQKQTKIRLQSEYSRIRRDLIINFTAATMMVGIIALWSFTPPGLIISIIAVAAITAVMALKSLVCRINAKLTKKALAHEFEVIEGAELEKGLSSQNDVELVESLDSTNKMTQELGQGDDKESDYIEQARQTYPPVLTPASANNLAQTKKKNATEIPEISSKNP
ncbi:hypothetical protein [Legionella impletisoli]|uniref:Uncharacterized protein n=1 Tax=Legionella impletisoli TaxID=343510 RepID=A0A917K066_9GAMM|nr:hypothetical protein [Legionella impletisoli]GGI91431.1 hypothetical protein GCM10007966_20160 [Legionella impletisoli]